MSLSQTETWSAVMSCFNHEPLAQDARNEVLVLRHVNQFSPLLLSWTAADGLLTLVL